MAIKKLIFSQLQDRISLKTGEWGATLLIRFKDDSVNCLVINDLQVNEIFKLEKLENISKVIFWGDKVIYRELKRFNPAWLSSCEVQICSSKNINVNIKSFCISLEESFVKNKKRVLIVDDSLTVRKLLKKIINGSESLMVVGEASDPLEAKNLIEELNPDLITLDIHMPVMTGVEFLNSYLKYKDIPVVIISSVSQEEGPLVMEALTNGASSYVQKPSVDKMNEITPVILQQLETVSLKRKKNFQATGATLKFKSLEGLIVIGSSTGGTQALQHIVQSLPKEIPPIVVVQHIPAVFSKALAERLNQIAQFRVKEAEHNEKLVANTFYIAPGGMQLQIKYKRNVATIVLSDDPPVHHFKPSVDVLFKSVSKTNIGNRIGVILTGMGSDGAQGMLELKNSGAYTIAQDEESCVVFGMPKVAISLGGVSLVTPLDKISEKIILNFNNQISEAA